MDTHDENARERYEDRHGIKPYVCGDCEDSRRVCMGDGCQTYLCADHATVIDDEYYCQRHALAAQRLYDAEQRSAQQISEAIIRRQCGMSRAELMASTAGRKEER